MLRFYFRQAFQTKRLGGMWVACGLDTKEYIEKCKTLLNRDLYIGWNGWNSFYSKIAWGISLSSKRRESIPASLSMMNSSNHEEQDLEAESAIYT